MKKFTKTIRTNKSATRRITGQGMTEYIIVLAMVALAAVVAVGYFGDTVQSQFAAMGAKLTGGDGSGAITAGGTAAAAAATTVAQDEDLGTYVAGRGAGEE